MAGECGGGLEARLPVFALVAEVSCKLPGPLLSLQIKPRKNKNGPIQASWSIEAEKRKKHHPVVEVA